MKLLSWIFCASIVSIHSVSRLRRKWSDRHTKSVCILNPILAIWRIYRSRIAVDVIEAHIGPVHDIYAPQLGIFDVEIIDTDIRYVPKYKRHRSARLRVAFLGCVPCIPIAVDATSAVPINPNILASDNEPSGVVLEGNWV